MLIKLFITFHRLKLSDAFKHPHNVKTIALQPDTNGNLFATACYDRILRLFDTRRNSTGKMSLIY